MWDKSILLLLGAVALVAGQGNQYLPPKDAPPPKQDKNYLPPEAAPATQDNSYLPPLDGQPAEDVPSVIQPEPEEEHHHHDDHDHHHEHWDLRESIPGEPGQDYPLHHSPPDTGFSCVGRTPGYYADVASGCQSFHVCAGDDVPPQSFLCPNGTIFHQKVFACEWWTDVDCASSEEHYSRNSEIGVVPESNVQRKPVLQGTKLLSRPIIVPEPDNDINFQSQPSNDVQGGLAYLPPVSETQKPSIPPVQRKPVQIPVRTETVVSYLPPEKEEKVTTRPVVATLSPAIVEQKYNRPAPVLRTTQRPQPQVPTLAIQAENAYLPPDLPATFPPLAPPTRSPPPPPTTRAPPPPPIQRKPVPVRPVQNEYLPPVPVTERPITRAPPPPPSTTRATPPPPPPTTRAPPPPPPTTRAPPPPPVQRQPVPVRPVQNEYLPPVPVTERLTTRAPPPPPPNTRAPPPSVQRQPVPVLTVQNEYLPPVAATERPKTFVPKTTENIVTQRTTFARTTEAPVTYATAKQNIAQITQQVNTGAFNSFAQQSYNQNSFSQVKQQSFSKSNGYNYQKPVVQFTEQTTRAPQTQQTYTTSRPTPAPTTKPSFAPTTQRAATTVNQVKQQQSFSSGSFNQVKQQSFSQSNGYNYQQPAVQFTEQTTRAPQTQQIYTTPRPTPAPTTKQTYATTTQRAAVSQQQSFNSGSFNHVKQQSFSTSNGYSYQQPSRQFTEQTTRAPQTQQIYTNPRPTPVPTTKQTFATTTQRAAVPVNQVKQQQSFISGSFNQVKQSFSQSNGYHYQQPSVQFSEQTTRAPQTQQIYTTQRPTPAPTTQRAALAVSQIKQQQSISSGLFSQVKQQSFSQSNGYEYQKPVVQFTEQTTRAPQTQQVFTTAAHTSRVTYAPTAKYVVPAVSQVKQQESFGLSSGNTQVKQQSFSQSNGYNYQQPTKVTLQTQHTTQQQLFTTQKTTRAPTTRQTFAPTTERTVPSVNRGNQVNQQQSFGSGSFSQVKQQSFSQSSGYNYQKPTAQFTEQTTRTPQTQQVFTTQKLTPAPINIKPYAPTTERVKPVFTQTKQQQSIGFNSGFSQVKQHSISQSNGYTYQKPTVFTEQTTRAPQTKQTTQHIFTTQRTTQVPTTRKTFVSPPELVVPAVNQIKQQSTFSSGSGFSQVKQQSFSQSSGYNYQKPAVQFNEQTTRSPHTNQVYTTQKHTPAPTTRQTYAPTTQRVAPVVSQIKQQQSIDFSSGISQVIQQTFGQSNGYTYQQPTSFTEQATHAPQTKQTTQQIFSTQRITAGPVTRQPFVSSTQYKEPVVSQLKEQQQSFSTSSGSFNNFNQQSVSQNNGYSYQNPTIKFTEQTTYAPQTEQIIITESPTLAPTTRQTDAPTTHTATSSVSKVNQQQDGFGHSSGFLNQVNQQTYSQSSGYTYDRPSVKFNEQVTQTQKQITGIPTHSSSIKTQSNAVFHSAQNGFDALHQSKNTADAAISTAEETEAPIKIDKQFIRINSLVVNDGSSNTGSQHSTANDQKTQTITGQAESHTVTKSDTAPLILNLGDSFTSHETSKTQTLHTASHASTVVKQSSSSDGYSYSSFSHPGKVPQATFGSSGAAVQQQNTADVSNEPCHQTSRDPLDELQTPVVFAPPAPFAAKTSGSSNAYSASAEGYHYPKPSIPFITPNNPTVKQAQQSSFNSFANQQGSGRYTEVSFGQQEQNTHHQSFVEAFKAASASTSHNFHSGSVARQQSGSGDLVRHEVEIVPSISFSYQLNHRKRAAEQQPTAAPTA